MAKPPQKREGQVRCAIYTRKSTEEGLEQEFNSLDAQREACAAYILSQKHEGWTMLPDAYDDGGLSGGSMERPALQRLLAAVAAGQVDVIVVYKVDRLTRSLADFAKIVDILDKAQASFVSVTQAFNTTTSMGRLTLNVLLSFAQFEREVTSERIRDKFAASKKKGMWMGGVVPLGYDVVDRKLVPNAAEAATVRHIFTRYLELGSTNQLVDELEAQGIRSKARPASTQTHYGSRVISRGALAHMLKNRMYIGDIGHKGQHYPGEHPSILDREIFDRVQAMLKANAHERRVRSAADQPSILAGMIVDAERRPMSPTHTTKGTRRYRYYVTAAATPGGRMPDHGWRIPAGEIEPVVRKQFCDWLTSEAELVKVMAPLIEQQALSPIIVACAQMSKQVTEAAPSELRELLLATDARITLKPDAIELSFDLQRLVGRLGFEAEAAERHTLCTSASLVRRGSELRLSFPPDDRSAPAREDVKLVGLIAKAEAAYDELLSGISIGRVRRAHLTRLARLKFLAPDITASILDGRQPARLSARALLRMSDIPISWIEQREALGYC